MTKDSDTTVSETKSDQIEKGMADPSDGPSTAASSNQDPPAPKPNRAERRRMKRQGKSIRTFINQMHKNQAKQKHKFNVAANAVMQQLGYEEFDALVAICTVKQPETKDDKGNVTKKASEFVNWKALFAEAKNMVVLRREQRILRGERKRSTGRSSDRKRHKTSLKFIKERGDAAIKNKEPYSEVKV